MNLYFTPVLLLLGLSFPVRVVSRSLPGMDKGQMKDSCVFYARSLLGNVTDALNQSNLFSGINCTKEPMQLNLETRTPTVCSPQGSTCSGITTSSFDQESCMTDIEKDLRHYRKVLSAQTDRDNFLDSSLYYLRELLENCFKPSVPVDSISVEAPVDHSMNAYKKRQELCKVMKGFRVRTITINRAIGYMTIGERTN